MASSSYFMLEVQELRRPAISHKLNVRWFYTINDIKSLIERKIHFPAGRMRLLLYSGSEALRGNSTLHDIGINESGFKILLSCEFGSNSVNVIEPVKGLEVDPFVKELITRTQQGLACSHQPNKTHLLDCTGGVYFLKSTIGSIIGVFKPQDEEQGMPNNPKGHTSQALRPYFKPGDGYLREYAAYLLDYNNFCRVPPTTIVHCEHPIFNYPQVKHGSKGGQFPKLGSLQQFIKASDSYEDISPKLITVLELQKIALLDMRLLNCDRNPANILALRRVGGMNLHTERRNSRSSSLTSWSDEEIDLHDFMNSRDQFRSQSDQYELVPIDHGYCLPTKLSIEDIDWAWMDAPQVALPVDGEIKTYINSLDIESLISNVKSQVALPEESLFLVRIVHELLLRGINAGLTLLDLARIIARTESGCPSPLEKAIASAEENAYRAYEIRGGGASSQVQIGLSSSPSRTNRLHFRDLAQGTSSSPGLTRNVRSEFLLENRETTIYQSSAKKPIAEINSSQYLVNEERKDYYLNELALEDSNKSLLTAPFQGAPLRLMQTIDSAGLSLFSFRRPESKSHDLITAHDKINQQPTIPKTNEKALVIENDYTSSDSSAVSYGASPSRFPLIIDEDESIAEIVEAAPKCSTSSTVNYTLKRVSSFDCTEVSVTEPLAKEREKVHSNTYDDQPSRSSSRNTTSGSTSPSDAIFDSVLSNQTQIETPISIPRVVSFGAFGSPALYDLTPKDGKFPRQFSRLRREKRKLVAKSQEFQELRQHFVFVSFAKLISKQLH